MKDFHLFHHLECAMYEKNPNPIKLNKDEQEVFDEAISHIENLIFGKWKTSRGKINTEILFDKEFKIDTFIKKGRKKRFETARLIIKGTKEASYKSSSLFGKVTGLITENHKGVDSFIQIFVNGFAPKKSFSEAYRLLPIDYWRSLTDLKITIRHELIHAKDPSLSVGTGDLLSEYGWLHYVNDPARTEFQADMGEWDQLTTELQDIVKNKEKNDFYKEVYEWITESFCETVKKDGTLDFSKFIDEFLDDRFWMIIPINKDNLKSNKEMIDTSQGTFEGALKKYEYWASRDLWAPKYEEQMNKWWLKNRAFKKGKIAKRPKKPKQKKKLSQSEKDQLFRKLQNNYTDMLSTIYSLFKKKGLLDICLDTNKTDKKKRMDELRSKRDYSLLRLEKVVIRSLKDRFRSLK